MSIFGVLSWLNAIAGIIGIALGLFTANWGLLVLAIVMLVQSAAWEGVEKLSDALDELKIHCGKTD